MTCKNCGNITEGNFCNNCGQKTNTQRINFSYLVDEFSNGVLQVNRGILFTVKELFTRPGHSIREYLEGKRKQHFRPLAFVLLVSAVYVFMSYLSGVNTIVGDILNGMLESSKTHSNSFETDSLIEIMKWFRKNDIYFTLAIIPIFSFASFISFKNANYNFFEHLVLNSYITGQQMIIYLIYYVVIYLTNSHSKTDYLINIPLFLPILYLFWTFHQFFSSKKLLTKVLHTILTYFLFSISIYVLLFFLALIIFFSKT